jgi:F-box protein 9
MAALPDEILVHILRDVATTDVGDFMRLAQVCKRLAYLVTTEDQIWRRVCVGPEFGFGGMHHHWQRAITWEPLDVADMLAESDSTEDEVFTAEDLQKRREVESHATTLALFRGIASGYPSWQAMFRRRPRVRFNGCYISTVNYIRPGQNLGQHLTWNTPVHIVTYYRYLRLFRDGTAISLTTTDEPAQVVHHLTRDNLALHRKDTTHQHLPSNVMASALRGRWRLSSPRDQDRTDVVGGGGGSGSGSGSGPPNLTTTPTAPPPKDNRASTETTRTATTTTITTNLVDAEGDLYIETEGVVGAKYMYRMDLTLHSAGKAAARNNKLVWRGFWSYNTLTDDWAQFSLKNGKPFFFSRVKSYGLGE